MATISLEITSEIREHLYAQGLHHLYDFNNCDDNRYSNRLGQILNILEKLTKYLHIVNDPFRPKLVDLQREFELFMITYKYEHGHIETDNKDYQEMNEQVTSSERNKLFQLRIGRLNEYLDNNTDK